MEGDFEDSGATQTRRKPQGGFAFFTIIQLVMAWTAFREARINLRELRAYFALAEMNSRRCGCGVGEPLEFTPLELRNLIGGAGGERSAVRKLLAVGLLRDVSKTHIEFATDPKELRFEPKTLNGTLDLIPNHFRLVPVPRRIIRLIAGGARRTLIAAILGHLIRCLFYKQGRCHPKGCVKASWIARAFGVSESAVKKQRHHLIELGWLIPTVTRQRTLNRHGVFLAINLAWDGLAVARQKLYEPTAEEELPAEEEVPQPAEAPVEAAPPPPPAAPPPSEPPAELTPPQTPYRAKTGTPSSYKEPLREDKNQKPASGGPAGISIPQSQKTETRSQNPTLRNVTTEDLSDPERLLGLHAQAVQAGHIPPSEAARLNFFAAANHARVIGSRNPPGLFVRIVRSGLWSFLTQEDEDRARVQLRRLLYPEPATAAPGTSPGRAPRPPVPVLSEDARFVRDITNVLRQRGVPESSVWRLVTRERPEWTRERWDAARAELQGTASPVAAMAAVGAC